MRSCCTVLTLRALTPASRQSSNSSWARTTHTCGFIKLATTTTARTITLPSSGLHSSAGTQKNMPLPLQVHPELSTPPLVQPVRPLHVETVQSVVLQPVPTEKAAEIIEQSKRLAAYTAVDNHVKPEHKIVGIGSGSTVPYVVERIVQQGKEANRERVFIPTGFQSKQLIVQAGLNLGDVDQYPTIDVTLDGADEVDRQLNCIKGGGACHLREKVLAEAARTFILVADYRKNVEYLGTNFKLGVPIEVVPFAYAKVLQNLHQVLGSPQASLRMATKKGKVH
ncbi:hypothetical protein AX15_005266 [Amanita polypyramis BW_CC]|nr:hypothetical protein AX15_005266 [Amanita polypyramis BW_CC]